MSRYVSNVDVTLDTFDGWVTKTNELRYALSTEILTANTTYANTGNTAAPRYGQLFGAYGANVIFANDQLRGGNVLSSGNLNITSNTIVTGNTFVSSANSLYTNTQYFTANISSNGALVSINGANLSITSNVNVVANKQILSGNTTVQNIVITGNSSYTNTYIGGTAVNVGSNVAIVGSVHTVGGNVNFDTGTMFVDSVNNRVGLSNTTPDATLAVTGTANVSSNTRIGGTLIVIGNTSISGTLAVTGSTNISNTLGTGNTTITGSLFVTTTATITGTTLINGATTVNNAFNAGNTVITGTANVSANVNIAGALYNGNTFTTVGPIIQGVSQQVFNDVYSNTNIGDNTAQRLIYSFPKANYSSGKILVKATNTGNTQIAEMVVAHDGTTPYLTVYGVVASPQGASEAPLGIFNVNINNANVEISMTQVRSNSAVTVVATLIK